MDVEERVPRIGEVQIHIQPDYYLRRAHQELAEGNDVRAVQNYVLYMESLGKDKVNEMKLIDQVNLTKLVLNLGAALEAMQEEDEVMRCYIEILNNLPKNVLILNALATYLAKNSEFSVAKVYFQLAANEGYIPAEKNLLHTLWHLIPRWHFRMLNDIKRNESYKEAIHKALKSGHKNVYDIGSGCGLLTLIAATFSKEVRVTAFEEDKTLFDLAQSIFKDHNIKNVNLEGKNSMVYEGSVSPCDLIVTEIFDSGLFGEHCLQTINHAVNCFPTGNFKIIPSGAKLYITAIESNKITRRYRYTESLPQLKLENICLKEVDPEPYDAEYLKNENIKYITEIRSFLEVDFYDKNQLNDLLSVDNDSIDEFELICTEKGVIHCFAVWFDLNLDDEITISTNPFDSDIKCWEQAIFHLSHPIPVEQNEIIKIKPTIFNNQLAFTVTSHSSSCEKCYQVSKEIISFLNDVELVEKITQTANCYENPDLKIIDFNVFPLFGFLMAKKGATVYHVYKDACDLQLFEHLMVLNELSSYKFIFIHVKAVEDYMVYMEPPNIIYTDYIKTDGSWNQPQFSVEMESKLNCESLPKKIFIKAQLIHSDFLDICNKVDNRKALNFNLAKHMNEFSGSEHPDLETLERDEYSSVVTFDVSDPELIDEYLETEITKSGTINGIFYWFEIQFTEDETNVFSTLHSFHYNKVCAIFEENKVVKRGDKVKIHLAKAEGYLKVYCE